MSLIRLENVSLAYGHVPLLDQVDLEVNPAERVCLVGRNGAGKSTLLKVIAGDVLPDDGQVWRNPGLRLARLQQDFPAESTATVFDVVADGLGDQARLLTEYHRLSHAVVDNADEQSIAALADVQHKLEAHDAWRFQQRIETVISKLQLPADTPMSELSGGWRRRVLLGQALVQNPDLLLLDEPTNHLDLDAILWLESFLLSQNIALVFITHDRAFLRKLATRIIELDRGILTSWPGNYGHYLEKKAERLEVEETQNALFDKKLAEEERWIRQGIKARRTRNEGRVRRLQGLREERKQRREQQGKVKMALDSGEQSSKIVFAAEDVSFDYQDKTIINDFSAIVQRGDKVAIMGPNGAGKSTLLKILLGDLQPTAGSVQRAMNLQVAYFDQQRRQLNEAASVMDNVAEGRDSITIGDKTRHVASYLKDFLFTSARFNSPVKSLSGGEKNRLLLAKLFAQPANLLVLDEPTNDLDVETLELLESLLTDFEGTLLLVSHDREFVDNIVTQTWVFEQNGHVSTNVGGYGDYLQQNKADNDKIDQQTSTHKTTKTPVADSEPKSASRKLSYKDQRELDSLPAKIEQLEQQQSLLQQQTSEANFYKQDQEQISRALQALSDVTEELEQSYQRWDELES